MPSGVIWTIGSCGRQHGYSCIFMNIINSCWYYYNNKRTIMISLMRLPCLTDGIFGFGSYSSLEKFTQGHFIRESEH